MESCFDMFYCVLVAVVAGECGCKNDFSVLLVDAGWGAGPSSWA